MLADWSRQNLNAECGGQLTECLKPVARDRITGGDHDDDTRDARRHILEQPQPLPGEGEFEIAEAGNIPGRPSEARDNPLSKRIGHCHEYDRYGLRSLCSGSNALLGPARMTSGCICTISLAWDAISSRPLPPHRSSAQTFRPSIQPSEGVPKGGDPVAYSEFSAPEVRMPTRRTPCGCWARAASGYVPATPMSASKCVDSNVRFASAAPAQEPRPSSRGGYHSSIRCL